MISDKKIKKLLVGPGHIDESDYDRAFKVSCRTKKDLKQVLVDEKLVEIGQLGHIIAEEIKVPYVNLSRERIQEDIMRIVPEPLARKSEVIPFGKGEGFLKIAMVDPSDLVTIHRVEKGAGMKVKVYFAMKEDLKEALTAYKPDMKTEYEELIKKISNISLSEAEKSKTKIRVVNSLLEHGYHLKASDVHIEPNKSGALLRFRIDGVMHDMINIPQNIYDLTLLRIKVMAKMKIDEHLKAQDGKLEYIFGEEKMDIRVSIVPVVGGENIVLRLLSEKNRQISLHNLGISSESVSLIEKSIKNQNGMILVAGPTGSGKTTTIYSMLELLNKKEVHVSTIEDPVEYHIEGLSQIQVNESAGLTFSKGLRAIVRQDPDIIMVGEVRDTETADIAVNSAMTGHLVLSTLHANDAVTIIPRLLEMGIKPFLIASTVKLLIAQRLVRKICEKCRSSYVPGEKEKMIVMRNEKLKKALNIKNDNMDGLMLFKGEGCKVCAKTGFKGRVGLYEVLEMDDEVREVIVQGENMSDIRKVMEGKNISSIVYDGAKKVLSGATTLSEILRVI